MASPATPARTGAAGTKDRTAAGTGGAAGSGAAATGRPLDATFSAPIEKDGAFPTFLALPGSAELLGTRAAVKVEGTLDGVHPFAATLMPSGQGPHWLPLRAALCKLIGKSTAGEVVTVHLEHRLN
ncbi:DUF1905 domain-containing protein [Actinotalea ferrariae]|uniref:DUF1905 domain-containing protein n=1 Tax=Actinotalea ferrariae TaxID=1386098 RepID=UPI001C8BA621|nr:DUF1905 domain-containing protein [Actinotalea ferrariae]MBX9245250.1 DUF1905 domain-containing protein [Actinotalea ferrariae]